MALYINRHYARKNRRSEKILLVAGSTAWCNLNFLSDDRGTIGDYQSGLKEFISYLKLMSLKGYKVRFLYSVVSNPSKDDDKLINYIEKHLVNKWEVIDAKSLDEWLSHIESASLLVLGRFHHTIAAACLGTPFIALDSNTPKIEGLIQSLDSKNFLH